MGASLADWVAGEPGIDWRTGGRWDAENEPAADVGDDGLGSGRNVAAWRSSPVDVASMADLHYPNAAFVVLDRVDNAVLPLPHSVFLLDGQFLTTWRTRILGEGSYSPDNPLEVLPGNLGKVPADGFAEEDAISGHSA